MKKIMYKLKDETVIKGFTEEILWKAVSYYGGPKEEMECLVSYGDNRICSLHCTGNMKSGEELFEQIMNDCFEKVYFSDDKEDQTNLTNDELIALYKQYNVWYDNIYYDDENMSYSNLIIYRGDDIPKYFVESEPKGPIDLELDDYEEIIEE